MTVYGKYMQLCEESPHRVALVNKFFRAITKQYHLCFLSVVTLSIFFQTRVKCQICVEKEKVASLRYAHCYMADIAPYNSFFTFMHKPITHWPLSLYFGNDLLCHKSLSGLCLLNLFCQPMFWHNYMQFSTIQQKDYDQLILRPYWEYSPLCRSNLKYGISFPLWNRNFPDPSNLC